MSVLGRFWKEIGEKVTWHLTLYLTISQYPDKYFFMRMAFGVVHKANISSCMHKLSWWPNFQSCIVNSSRIFHFRRRIQNLQNKVKGILHLDNINADLENEIKDDDGSIAVSWCLVIMKLLQPLNLGRSKTSDSALKCSLPAQWHRIIFLVGRAHGSQNLWRFQLLCKIQFQH